jgi:hypothetical protein
MLEFPRHAARLQFSSGVLNGPRIPERSGLLARFAAIALITAVLASCEQWDDEPLRLVKPRLGIDQQLAADFARLLDEPGRIRIVLVDNPNSELPGIEAVKEGFADLALTPNTAAYDPKIEAVVPLYPSVLHIAYRYSGSHRPVRSAPCRGPGSAIAGASHQGAAGPGLRHDA